MLNKTIYWLVRIGFGTGIIAIAVGLAMENDGLYWRGLAMIAAMWFAKSTMED
jgi:hypothetical protein